MAGQTSGLTKGYKASGAIGRRLIVKFGAADHLVALAAAVGDAMFGVSAEIDAADGEPCDVRLSGIAEVIYGGAVARGDLLTSDAAGRAIAAAPAAGVNNRVIGVAQASGALGDVGVVQLSPGRIQG